jgi:hypothetical protein
VAVLFRHFGGSEVRISVASRWLVWLLMKITGGFRPSRLSRPKTCGEVSFHTSGFMTPERTTSRAARPVLGRRRIGLRGARGHRPAPPAPALRDVDQLVGQRLLLG